jgi:hypothetical protein
MLFVPTACIQSAPNVEPTSAPLKAQYGWGYVGDGGEGTGTVNLLLDAATGKLVIELFGLGERLFFLSGDASKGYRLQIPRDKVDVRAATLSELSVPYFPKTTGLESLQRLLESGEGDGVSVSKRDDKGPVKLQYQGQDSRQKPFTVWLTRKLWDKKN